MIIAYQSNTGLTIQVNHDKKTYQYKNGFGYDCILNVGTNKRLKELEIALLSGGYTEQ